MYLESSSIPQPESSLNITKTAFYKSHVWETKWRLHHVSLWLFFRPHQQLKENISFILLSLRRNISKPQELTLGSTIHWHCRAQTAKLAAPFQNPQGHDVIEPGRRASRSEAGAGSCCLRSAMPDASYTQRSFLSSSKYKDSPPSRIRVLHSR